MEVLRCAGCGNVLSVPVRLVVMPTQPQECLLDHHHVNPPLLEAGAYAVDEVPYGRDEVKGTLVLSPGDVRGTRFVHERVETGCWSLTGWAGPPDFRPGGWGLPEEASRAEFCATHWRVRGLKSQVYRDDPPA